MKNDLAKVLITQEELARRVAELGAQISADYVEKEPILVCILKGASIFYADLCRAVTIPMNMDFMAVSSYGNRTKSSGGLGAHLHAAGQAGAPRARHHHQGGLLRLHHRQRIRRRLRA